jgi:glycosyltransferase involved in cell wall biosynthesis
LTPVRISLVIPTLGRAQSLGRVLDRLERQTVADFEVVVVADAKETAPEELDRLVAGRPFAVQRLQADRPGASAARNAGWRAARSPLVLFIDDDILPEPPLVAEHLAWHERTSEDEVGVLGHVRWADELDVTPFMHWLVHGVQFDYPKIRGDKADWGFFYTANASVKRALLEDVGGFEEVALPFGYEDLDLARRMHDARGFRLLYNRAALAEHVHEMDLDYWKRRVTRIAVSERKFTEMHPWFEPYFFEMFSGAAAAPSAGAWPTRLIKHVPKRLPLIGPAVWRRADLHYGQALAPHFLEAWRQEEEELSSAGSPPGGPK